MGVSTVSVCFGEQGTSVDSLTVGEEKYCRKSVISSSYWRDIKNKN